MMQVLEGPRSCALGTEVIEIALDAGQAILGVYKAYLTGSVS